MSRRHRVLVVDDSAFARKVVREILEGSGLFEVVGIASDGLEALESIAELEPDAITLDLVMPELDGVGVLEALGDRGPPAVVVSVSGSDTSMGAAALLKGAFDLVEKPSAMPTDRLYEMRDELVAKVLAAATSKKRPSVEAQPPIAEAITASRFRLLALGASTGGPRALSAVITALPPDLPIPVVFALHIPEGYTKPLAERIGDSAQLRVMEGRNGMPLERGTAVIVPGGHQAEIVGSKQNLRLAIFKAPPASYNFAPSIDLLFESAARVASPVLGVVLTGMGNDGTRGAAAIRKHGGEIITESEESCVVYGMPRAVMQAGQSDRAVPLEQIAAALVRRLAKG